MGERVEIHAGAAAGDGDRTIQTCARCRGRFPGPGVAANGRVYCCDKCAAGPSAKNMLPMLPAISVLIGAGAVLGWLAARSQR